VIPRAFGESAPFSLGAEEELFVVDAEALAPAVVPPDVLRGERVKPELFAAVVEVATGICADAAMLLDEVGALRGEAAERLAGHGLALAGTGTWPTAVPEEQQITPDPGYLRFIEFAGSSAQRQFCSGLHVHVGVESADACMTALEHVLPWLPLLLALSANSPWLAGRESGLCSTRAEILALLPRSGAPPVFDSYADWERFAERLLELDLADTYRRIWWDARPHPSLGTLEIRMPDQPGRAESTAAFAALVQALVASAEPGPPADRGIYAENRWAASRFGRDARLIHPDGTRLVPVPELLDELFARVGAKAEELGGAPLLDPLAGLDQAGEQLELGRREGLDALCRRLVALAVA
jgi:carboxylate-amine ligase